MGKGKRRTTRQSAEPLDVDKILRDAEAERRNKSYGDITLRSAWSDYGRPYSAPKTEEEIRADENRQRLRELNIGTEKTPHNRQTSSRERKAARAAVRSAQTSGKKR